MAPSQLLPQTESHRLLFPTETLAGGFAVREEKVLTEEEAKRDDARRTAAIVFFFGGAPSLLAQWELVWSKGGDESKGAAVGARVPGARKSAQPAKARLGRAGTLKKK